MLQKRKALIVFLLVSLFGSALSFYGCGDSSNSSSSISNVTIKGATQ